MRPDERSASVSAPLFFLSAGEASGDHYGAVLIGALRQVLPGARFTGLGGTGMQAAGQERVVRAEDVAAMGITEILRHVPRIMRSYRALVRSMYRERPDVAVLIDFPDVNFRLAKHLKRLGVPVIWFVSPQLWAWKRRRLRWVQQRVDRMLVIFPFEEPFYRAQGVAATFVGHPLAEATQLPLPREELVAEHLFVDPGIAASNGQLARPWIALLPGSRWKEVVANLPTMLQAAVALGGGYDFLVPVASTLDLNEVRTYVFDSLLPRLSWRAGSSLTLVRDARAALHHARASVVASGTATIEAAVAGNPFVVVYRVSRSTYRLARHLIRYPAEIPAERDAAGNLPVAMVNLIAGRRIVPELLNDRFTAEGVVAALRPLLEDGPPRTRQIEALADVKRKLAAPGAVPSTQRVVNEVLDLLRR